MCAKQRKRLDRPFAPEILERARKIAARYQIIVSYEDGEYYGRGLELPWTMDDGKTPEACLAATREALVATVAAMLEMGQAPPAPASDSGRTEQVNIRLTSMEKRLIEEAARARGFRGISDYMRALALSGR